MGINPITRNMMEIIRDAIYDIKSHTSPRVYNWWAHPRSKHKVKVILSSLLPLSVSGSVKVRAGNKLDIQALQDALSGATNFIEPHRLSGFNFTAPSLSMSQFYPENFETEEIITEEWLIDNGFIKTGRVEVRVGYPIIELAE